MKLYSNIAVFFLGRRARFGDYHKGFPRECEKSDMFAIDAKVGC